jgi:hypothetical protein
MHTFTVMKNCNDKPGRKEKTKNGHARRQKQAYGRKDDRQGPRH